MPENSQPVPAPAAAPASPPPVHVVMLDYGAVRLLPAAEAQALIAKGLARLASKQDIAIGG